MLHKVTHGTLHASVSTTLGLFSCTGLTRRWTLLHMYPGAYELIHGRSVKLVYPSCAKSTMCLIWMVTTVTSQQPVSITTSWCPNKVGVHSYLIRRVLQGAKFTRGWDQLMYGSLTLLYATWRCSYSS